MAEPTGPETLRFEVTVAQADLDTLESWIAERGARAGHGRCVLGPRAVWLRVEGGRIFLRTQLPLEALPGPWQAVHAFMRYPGGVVARLAGGTLQPIPIASIHPALSGRLLALARSGPPAAPPDSVPDHPLGGVAALAENLLAGLLLATTLSVRGLRVRASPAQLMALLGLLVAALALPDLVLTERPRQFFPASLAVEGSRALLVALIAYAVVGYTRPGDLARLLVLLSAAALLPVALAKVYLGWRGLDGSADESVLYLVWVGWLAVLVIRAVQVVAPPSARVRWSGALLAGAALALTVDAFPSWPVFETVYAGGQPGAAAPAQEPAPSAVPAIDAEAIYYAQPALLDRALAGLAPQRPGRTDLYFVGFAPFAAEAVFMREVRHFQRFMDQRFDTAGRSLLLINHPAVVGEVPLANRHNLDRVLRGLARVIDVEEDIVFLYLTSHGSEDGYLVADFAGLPLGDLSAETLGRLVARSGIKWRVVGVSACFSGAFVDAVAAPTALLMTAARADRASFGCSNDREFTYFGEALRQALAEVPSFEQAFEAAQRSLLAREQAEGLIPSLPQIRVGEEIRGPLRALRRQLESG